MSSIYDLSSRSSTPKKLRRVLENAKIGEVSIYDSQSVHLLTLALSASKSKPIKQEFGEQPSLYDCSIKRG